MRKCRQCVLTLMIIFCLSGCSSGFLMTDSEAGIYEKIHHYYQKMASYSARLRMRVYGNKTENIYEVEQYVKGSDKSLLRITAPEDIAGVETVTNGENMVVRKGKADAHALVLSAQKELDICFLGTFLRYYYHSEETAVSVSSSGDSGGTTLLETNLPQVEEGKCRATLLVDNKTLAPKSITVYDAGGNIKLLAEFTEFVYNDAIDDIIFEMES